MKSMIMFKRMICIAGLALICVTGLPQIANTSFKNTSNPTRKFVVPDLEALGITSELRTTTRNKMSTRAARHFVRQFKNVNNELWFQIGHGYLAEFSDDGVKTSVAYDNSGRWNYTIRRYGEDHLDKEIRAMVKSVYFDYTIKLVEEIWLYDRLIYLVNVEDADGYKKIRICNKEMEVIEELHKLKP